MIGRKSQKVSQDTTDEKPRGFDDFELRLGDVMRGERATLGKSLLDVQRELRIKASYIAAIENCDPTAFDTPGFIAGYVRSYARYLNLDPDAAFAQFCAESGFQTAHGMSQEASGNRKKEEPIVKKGLGADPLTGSATPFVPVSESVLSRIEPGALGSVAVLVALIGALGYGGWSILTEVQRVQFAPVEQAPDVLSDLDPIQAAPTVSGSDQGPQVAMSVEKPAEGLDRLYRPEALDVPLLVSPKVEFTELSDGYRTLLDEKQLGYEVTAFAMVGLHSQTEGDLNAFEEKVMSWPEVRESYMLSGEVDFLLKCVVPDLQAFQNFIIRELTATPNVDSVRTALTIRQTKNDPVVPMKE